jgi:hypothetical protein
VIALQGRIGPKITGFLYTRVSVETRSLSGHRRVYPRLTRKRNRFRVKIAARCSLLAGVDFCHSARVWPMASGIAGTFPNVTSARFFGWPAAERSVDRGATPNQRSHGEPIQSTASAHRARWRTREDEGGVTLPDSHAASGPGFAPGVAGRPSRESSAECRLDAGRRSGSVDCK